MQETQERPPTRAERRAATETPRGRRTHRGAGAPAPARPGPDPAAGTRAHRRDARREVDRRRRR
ncbi:hypothetical protein, partial [Phycicoccus flavus]|uniref:hypothetical protein n=1 Tax=Phycicoccus flavus TaxID=2502783 RepID=UPI00197B0CE0